LYRWITCFRSEPYAYAETTKVRLPAEFAVDELPDPVKLEASFGSYTTSYVVKDGQLEFTRKLVVRQATVPVADYAKVRSFFEKVRAAEQSPGSAGEEVSCFQVLTAVAEMRIKSFSHRTGAVIINMRPYLLAPQFIEVFERATLFSTTVLTVLQGTK